MSEVRAATRPLVVAVCVSLGLMAAPAVAQEVPSQLPGQTPQDVDPAGRTPGVQPALVDPATLLVPVACPFAGKGTLTLARITVTGATLVPSAEVDEAVADLLGRPADAAILCTARDRVAAVYARHGEALARVDLPQQQITDGVLTLHVTEGRVVEARVENGEAQGPSAALANAYLQSVQSDGATRWAEVERAFMLVRELPGAEPRFALRRADDGSDNGLEAVVAFAPRRKVDFTFSAQNLGSEALGREGASLRVDANGFTRFGERTSLVLFSSLSGDQRVVQLMEEARLGASAWVAFGDIAFGRSEPGGALAPLELEGDSTVARLGARYGWIKQRNKAVDLGVRIESVDQQNDLGFLRSVGLGTIPLFDERLSVLALEANGRWRSLGALATVFGVEVRQGLAAFGASKSGDALLSRAEGRTDFTSFRGNATARWTAASVDARPYLQAAASGQWTDDPLPAYEEFQVGNYTVGRGFDPGAASGDRAIAVQLEAGIDFSAGAGMASIYGFADHARLWNLDADSYDSSPRSSGLGLRLQGRAGRLDLAWALPQNGAFPGAPKSEDRLLVTYTNHFSIR